MAIEYKIRPQDGLLKVSAHGKDENLKEVMDYSNAVIDAAVKYKCHKVLCDERKLMYAISITETFQLAEEASAKAPGLSKIAIVCKPENIQDGRFYETVANNRGLKVLVTTEFEEALDWLK